MHDLTCDKLPDLPELKFGFVKIYFHVFAVLHTELYVDALPAVIPLGCCRLPNNVGVIKSEGNNIFKSTYLMAFLV